MKNNPSYLGTVQDVKGATVSVALESTLTGLTFIKGQGYRIGQVGSFVRISLGYIDLFGVISQSGASAVPDRIIEKEPFGYRWLTVQLIGEGHRRGNFKRGVSQLPTIGEPVHLVSENDLARIYGHPDKPFYVRIGNVASAESIPALIDINKLITRHSAILGATGTGKSTTVASMLTSLSDENRYPSARIIVFDIHGEYSTALSDRANIYKVNPDTRKNELPLYIPYWAMNFEEFISLTLGNVDEKDKGIILEKIVELKNYSFTINNFKGITPETLTVDTPIPFSINKLWYYLHRIVYSTHTKAGSGQYWGEIVEKIDTSKSTEAFLKDDNGQEIFGDASKVIPPKYEPQLDKKIYLSGSTLNIRRALDKLASQLRDTRYNFLFKPGNWLPDLDGKVKSDLDEFLKNWVGGPKPITILDLSGVPITILNDLVGILLRILFDALFWSRDLSEGGKQRPLLVVLEEAHSYLNESFKGFASETVQRIVKEGRKYGIGAMIVSQRPSEINSTILSQCGTFFALRLSNETDRSQVTAAVTDNLEGLTSMLPILRTGEAIIIGEAVKLPMRALIEVPLINRRPDSLDPIIYEENEIEDQVYPGGWGKKLEKNSNYNEVVEVWRSQNPRSPSISDEIEN